MNLERGEYTENLTYDLNGNIGTLKRKGRQFPGYTAPENMDDLAYEYEGNHLTKVRDHSENPSGYPLGGKAFGYDDNGNMTVQEDKGLSIAYNYLNLPQNIASPQGNTAYVYNADGTKVKKTAGSKVVDYLNGFQYENSTLQFFPTSEGYFDVVKNKYIYNYTDHLGNVRLSYMNSGSGVEIIEESNYYPFGLKHEGYNTSVGNAVYQYKYSGKELQETGMYDYGARFYMPDIGRWGVIDPRSQYTHEAYSYVWNNPIFFNDPTGMTGEGFAHCPTCPNTPEFKPYIDDKNDVYVYNPETNTASLKVTPIQEVTLTGKAKSSDSGPGSLALAALMVSQADSPAPGPADVVAVGMLIGAGVWWTYNQFTQPSYTTIADPGVGMRNLNSESDADDTDVNGVKVPKEGNERTADNPLRRDKDGNAIPDDEAAGTEHTQLGTKQGRKGAYKQGREFDKNGNPVRDVDHTDHGRPGLHTNPHQHKWNPNKTGGTRQRGGAEPL